MRVKKYLEEVVSIKWLVIGIVFYFYGHFLKRNVMENAPYSSINGWDITLQLMNDMYLIVYFIFPLILYLSIKSILFDFDYQLLIRLGSYKRWVHYSFIIYWKRSAPLLFLWVFMSFFLMIGLPYSWSWSQFSKSISFSNTLNGLINFFDTPIFAFGFHLISLILVFSFLQIGLSILYVITQNKNFILITCVVFFLGGMAGFKLLPEEFAFLSPTTYFSITKAVNSFSTPFFSLFVIVIYGIACLIILKRLDFNNVKITHTVKQYFPILIYFILCLLGIISNTSSLDSNKATIWDVWLMSYRGASSESFAYFPFIFYCIVFFGFVYLINLVISKEIEYMGYYKIIRYRNINKWFWSWFKRLLITLFLLLLILTGLSLFIAVCMGFKTNFYFTVFSISLFEAFCHFLINGFFQITLYIFAIFIVSWVRKEATYGLITISVLMIMMLPGINKLVILPIGLNSFSYLNEHAWLSLTLILIPMNIIAYILINVLTKKSFNI
jgi:hypothetical protein